MPRRTPNKRKRRLEASPKPSIKTGDSTDVWPKDLNDTKKIKTEDSLELSIKSGDSTSTWPKDLNDAIKRRLEASTKQSVRVEEPTNGDNWKLSNVPDSPGWFGDGRSSVSRRSPHTYPQQLTSELEDVHRKLRKTRGAESSIPTSTGTRSTEQIVFVVVHEEYGTYCDTNFSIVGVYAEVEEANKKVLELFHDEHGEFLEVDGDGFVRKRMDDRGDGMNEVWWWIDKCGGLSLKAENGGGDEGVYKVYASRQKVQAPTGR